MDIPAAELPASTNRSRSQIRSETKVSNGVRSSLQECSLAENQEKLENFVSTFKAGSAKETNLKALVYILQCMTVKVPNTLSFMKFGEAFAIFESFRREIGARMATSVKDLKREFRNLLCSRQYGLCVYLVQLHKCELLVLKSDADDVCLMPLLSFLVNKEVDQREEMEDEGVIDKEYCQELVSVMDTEWDKCVFRVFVAQNRTNSEVDKLGFDSDSRTADKEKVKSFVESKKEL